MRSFWAVLGILFSTIVSADDFATVALEGHRRFSFPQPHDGMSVGDAFEGQMVYLDQDRRALSARAVDSRSLFAERLIPHLAAAWQNRLDREGLFRPVVSGAKVLSWKELVGDLRTDLSRGGREPGAANWLFSDLAYLSDYVGNHMTSQRFYFGAQVRYTDILNRYVDETVHFLVDVGTSRVLVIRRLDRYGDFSNERIPSPSR